MAPGQRSRAGRPPRAHTCTLTLAAAELRCVPQDYEQWKEGQLASNKQQQKKQKVAAMTEKKLRQAVLCFGAPAAAAGGEGEGGPRQVLGDKN